ncbi:hypothetical protein FOMPIDRAFT_1096747, partial [Fomitopsis schrenkii]
LSCLLFDIAIEPLACALRTSELKGFTIPGVAERLITTLFADDTSTFLSEHDSWSDLWKILHKWCKAARAKFNDGKTEVIPIGLPEYREWVRESRQINKRTTEDKIPEGVKIAKEGEAVRLLGAWIGNGVDQAAVWAPALQKTRDFVTRWKKCRPSLKGKVNIVRMGPGGITQYLAMVQGMPKSAEREVEKIIKEFLWDGQRVPAVSMETLRLPVEEGGLGLLDVGARNDAIEIMWMKGYLQLDDKR